MVGSAFKKYEKDGIIRVGSKDFDLTNYSNCCEMIEDNKPDAIIHLAAKVGGVKGNTDLVGEFFRDNILMNTNVLESARALGVEKVMSLLSTCIYPDKCQYPLTEEQIHSGRPHHSNYGYAYAKRMLDVQSRAYRQQFGCNYITIIPNNLFGIHDNFDLEDSHVIPAMIRKFYEARRDNSPVILWGDGTPLREFTYSGDMAKIILFLLENYNSPQPINVGSVEEHSIGKIADIISDIYNFKGDIIWDTSGPPGQFRKPSSNSLLTELGWPQDGYSDFQESLRLVCEWFEKSYETARGVAL